MKKEADETGKKEVASNKKISRRRCRHIWKEEMENGHGRTVFLLSILRCFVVHTVVVDVNLWWHRALFYYLLYDEWNDRHLHTCTPHLIQFKHLKQVSNVRFLYPSKQTNNKQPVKRNNKLSTAYIILYPYAGRDGCQPFSINERTFNCCEWMVYVCVIFMCCRVRLI